MRLCTMTIQRPDLLEIAAMRARWKEERAAGATGETFARWRVRVKAEVVDDCEKSLMGIGGDGQTHESAFLVSRSDASAAARNNPDICSARQRERRPLMLPAIARDKRQSNTS